MQRNICHIEKNEIIVCYLMKLATYFPFSQIYTFWENKTKMFKYSKFRLLAGSSIASITHNPMVIVKLFIQIKQFFSLNVCPNI